MVPSSSGSRSSEKRNALALKIKPQSFKISELHIQQLSHPSSPESSTSPQLHSSQHQSNSPELLLIIAEKNYEKTAAAANIKKTTSMSLETEEMLIVFSMWFPHSSVLIKLHSYGNLTFYCAASKKIYSFTLTCARVKGKLSCPHHECIWGEQRYSSGHL